MKITPVRITKAPSGMNDSIPQSKKMGSSEAAVVVRAFISPVFFSGRDPKGWLRGQEGAIKTSHLRTLYPEPDGPMSVC